MIGGPDAADAHRRLAAAGVDAAFREGNVRLSLHLYNTPADVDRALAELRSKSVPGSSPGTGRGS